MTNAYDANANAQAGGVPSLDQLRSYTVNRAGVEAVRQSLYDSQQYPIAGSTQMTFFANPLGQGTNWTGTGVKNLSDTNMTLAGQLPTNQTFLVQSIEIMYLPATPTSAANMPAAMGTQAIAAQVNDAYIFRRAGNLTLTIGSKTYLQEGPLMRFPPKTDFGIEAAIADVATTGNSNQSRIAYATAKGRPYMINRPPLLLESNQNFSLTLNWPEGVQAVSTSARVIAIMDGLLYRRSQ